LLRLLFPPVSVEFRVVIAGVIRDDHNTSATFRAGPTEMLEERMECHRIKSLCFSMKNKFSIPQTDGAKISDAFARRVMQQNRIGFFWRHPHEATRSVLLEMNLIGGPQINARIVRELSEFFYMPPEEPDPRGQSRGAVFLDESPGV
jgi:hypothetical protein